MEVNCIRVPSLVLTFSHAKFRPWLLLRLFLIPLTFLVTTGASISFNIWSFMPCVFTIYTPSSSTISIVLESPWKLAATLCFLNFAPISKHWGEEPDWKDEEDPWLGSSKSPSLVVKGPVFCQSSWTSYQNSCLSIIIPVISPHLIFGMIHFTWSSFKLISQASPLQMSSRMKLRFLKYIF